MSFYENTLIAKQDLPAPELKKIIEKYNDIINNNSGKVVKIEEWGLLNLANKNKGNVITLGDSLTFNSIFSDDLNSP